MTTRELPPFAALLRRHRVSAGLSQEALAERAGLSVRGLSDLERGLSRARLDTLTRLAEALGLDAPARLALVSASGYLPPEAEAEAEGGPSSPPPAPATAVWPARSLPGYLTGLIGREQDQAAVARLLRDRAVRLLTLSGPGGVGKTRLAVQVAEGLTGLCPAGVHFVALAPVTDAALVPAAIAEAIGVVDLPDAGDLDSLVLAIGAQPLLLVLDNFEQVLGAAHDVVALLLRCPNLRVIITSRTALGVNGEQVFAVQPLLLPPAAQAATPETVGTWPGVALFVERAQAAQATFALTAANVDAVVGICRRLDGLPLALELAAARIPMLPPEALLARLERALPLLTRGDRDAPPRHRTLRDAVAWSYDLLGGEERELFAALGVFAGGWHIATAATLWAETFDAEDQVIAGLATLLNHSLIQSQPPPDGQASEPRYVMLETMREFALEQLEASGRAAQVRGNHARAFLRVAEDAEPHVRSERRGPWLQRLDAELDNLRGALAWSATEAGDTEVGLRLVGSIWGFWYLRGHLQEGRRWTERLLAKPDAAGRSAGRARALYGLGGLALLQGDTAPAHDALDDSVRLMRADHDPRLPEALTHLGWAKTYLGQPAEALVLFRESTVLAQQQGDTWWLAYNYATEATALAGLGDRGAGVRRYEDSLALFEGHADAWGRAIAQRGLAGLRALDGELAAARDLYAESAAVLRQVGDRRSLAQTLQSAGRVALQADDAAAAQAIFAEALAAWQHLGIRGGSLRALNGLALALAAQTRLAEATWVFGVVHAHTAPSGVRPPTTWPDTERWISEARSHLGETAFAAAWDSGRALPLDQAVPKALALSSSRGV